MTLDLVNPFSGSEATISATGLEKRFGQQTALAGFDLTVPRGAVYILVGPNGAGKTTFLRTLLDLVRADRGEASVFGLSTIEDGPSVRAQIGYVPDSRDLSFTDLKVGQLLEHHAVYFPSWEPDYAATLVRALDINLEHRCSSLSKGQARRVQLVQALAHRPALLLMDEPTDGLDPLVRDQVMALIIDHLATSPATVLISTHLVHEVEGLGSHMGTVRNGRVIAQLERGELDRRLLSVRGEVPDDWHQDSPFPILGHSQMGREHCWTLWADGEAIESRLEGANITVRSIESMTLDAASRTFLAMEVPS